ncbi:MAG: flavin reductase family protein [Steroidobacteraceae bacterium]
MIDPDAFKQAMSSFPTGVVIAATLDGEGEPWGFTASSFSSVSLDPPLVLVCLAKDADCHPAFAAARAFSISILRAGDEALARLFATRGASKFACGEFTTGEHGLPLMPSAVAALACRKFADFDCGDHTVIVGEVESVRHGSPEDALVYYRRDYWRLRKPSLR